MPVTDADAWKGGRGVGRPFTINILAGLILLGLAAIFTLITHVL